MLLGSFVFVNGETADAFLEVKEVEIVECHEMAIASEDEHLVAEDVHGLTVSGARFLADDKFMTVVVDYLLS